MLLTGPHLAVFSDSKALAFCHTSAFSSAGPHTGYNIVFSGCDYDTMMKLDTRIMEASFKPGSNSKIVVMRDDVSGEIISYAQWTPPVSNDRAKDPEENLEQIKANTESFDFPDGVNVPLFKRKFLQMGTQEAEKEAELPVPQEQCWNLNRIGTRPEYQGKGAAKALVKWGTDQADREGTCCVLSTDPGESAFQVYKKAGFEVVGSVSEIELDQFGSSGILRCVRMIRYPQKTV